MDTLAVAHKVLYSMSHKTTFKYGPLSWALIYDGVKYGDTEQFLGTACFFMLSNVKKEAKYLVAWCFSRRMYEKPNDSHPTDKIYPLSDIERDYINFIVNDSVFAKCFETKDADTIFRIGAVLKTDMPAQFVYAAFCCIRMVSEQSLYIILFNRFKEHIGPDAALVLAHLFYLKDTESKTYQYSFKYGLNHSWVGSESSFGKEEFKKYIDRDLKVINKLPSMFESNDYTRVTKIWTGKTSTSSKFTLPTDETVFTFDNIKTDLKNLMEINYGQEE